MVYAYYSYHHVYHYLSAETAEISSAKNIIPLNLRTRAATATALGVAAANAKLLADQEEKEIGNLVSVMIEAQVLFLFLRLLR